MKYSIIVPVYNTEKYVAECLDSLLCQEGDFEVLVINDGSTDQSLTIAKEYEARDSRVRLYSQENRGLGAVRNRALELAQGDYLIFVDSDDTLATDALKKIDLFQDKILQESADHRMDPHDIIIFPFGYQEGERITREVGFENVIANGKEKAARFSLVPVTICGKVFHRRLFEKSNLHFPEKRYYEDMSCFFLWMVHVHQIHVLEEPLYIYRQREGSITKDLRADKLIEILPAMEQQRKFLVENHLEDEYGDLLEYYAIIHVMTEFIPKMVYIKAETQYVRRAWNYMKKYFPDYDRNPYLDRLSSRNRFYYQCVRDKKFGKLYWVMTIKSGVKKFLTGCRVERWIEWYRRRAVN